MKPKLTLYLSEGTKAVLLVFVGLAMVAAYEVWLSPVVQAAVVAARGRL